MNKEIEMFEELTFSPHRNSRNAISAKRKFDNGCLISVVTGEGLYGDLDALNFMILLLKWQYLMPTEISFV